MTETHPSADTRTAALTRLELELTPGSEPISGYLHDAAGRHSFVGWIDLTSAIEAARQRKATATPETTPKAENLTAGPFKYRSR